MPRQLSFVVHTVTRSADEFEAVARQAERLKRHGRVLMDVSSLSGRTVSDVPPGGSSWHDYTTALPSLEKFFPHRDMVPFLDRDHIERNRRLLRAVLTVLRRHQMGAAFHVHVPWYLPQEFFAKYPHRRGPRIDHPRRSRREAFALCPDLPENLEIFADMFGQLVSEVPELALVNLSTNDAGGGLCWADWLYSGPNGPVSCRGRGIGPRVRGLIDAFRKAAPGRDIDFDLNGNFSDTEMQAMAAFHNERFHTRAQRGQNPRHVHVSARADNPVLGLFNPIAQLAALARVRDGQVDTIAIELIANYRRGQNLPEVADKVFELVDTYLAEPAHGLLARLQFLRRRCATWVGEGQADALLEALYDMDQAFEYRQSAVPQFTTNYGAVSMRHVTRPLVAVPERLSPEEEAYWLPHVFNPSIEEARRDYIDFHGGRLSGPVDIDQGTSPRVLPIDAFHRRLNGVADRLGRLDGEGAAVFRRMGTALRIYASLLRSSGNFYAVQKVRDRNLDKLAGAPRTPSKVADWVGDPDLQMLNEFMRDELDNTTELVRLLEAGGMNQVLTASDPADEDTFLLGPGLIDQLKQKLAIMARHWTDAQDYLATPHK